MVARLEHASVIRSGRAILDDATGECQPSRFTAFCGPNGAGKTTALSVLTGALKPDRGQALLEGQNIRSIDRGILARQRAVVAQSSALTFPFQAYEVVSMRRAPHLGRTTRHVDLDIVNQALEKMDVTHLAERNYLTLSGGERKRVDIARALAQIWDAPESGGTRWLFLDEPTAALDLKYQISLMRELRDLKHEGWGIIAVLHDLHLVKKYADDVWLFKNGKVEAIGEANSLLTAERIQSVFELDAPYAMP
ncbi:MAG: ATP-binding cassette domain-containing protein [Pseudomonadota bacterium]